MLKFTKDSFVQNLARGQIVVPYLESFDEYDEPWSFTYTPKETDDAWHPSGDCVPSVSALYAKALDPSREPHSPRTQRNFIVGHFWHALIQHVLCNKLEFCTPDAVERRGTKVWDWIMEYEECSHGCVEGHSEDCRAWRVLSQTPRPYHWAAGSGDIAPLVMPNWRGVFDIKTMAGAVWQKAWKSGLLPPGFDHKYECQVNVYMDFFDEEKALILAVNKDNPHGFAEFEFERNQDLIDTIYAKWEYVSYCLDMGVEPDPEADDEFKLPLTGPVR